MPVMARLGPLGMVLQSVVNTPKISCQCFLLRDTMRKHASIALTVEELYAPHRY